MYKNCKYSIQGKFKCNEKFKNSFQIHKIFGKIVKTKEELNQGLMYIKELKDNEGMLFQFKKNDNHSFWMKNTLIPLDLIFLNEDDKVIGFIKNMKPGDLNSNGIKKKSFNVVEVKAKFINKNKLKIGDKIKFN